MKSRTQAGLSAWRRELPAFRASPDLASWLRESGSLTKRCQGACSRFAVQLLGCRVGVSLFGTTGNRRVFEREVLLICDGRPVIFAHTELALRPRGPLSIALRRLGNRSLGSLLFSSPCFRRGKLEYRRLEAGDALFRRAVDAAELSGVRELWARRCVHYCGKQAVLVTEVFLPSIHALADGFRARQRLAEAECRCN